MRSCRLPCLLCHHLVKVFRFAQNNFHFWFLNGPFPAIIVESIEACGNFCTMTLTYVRCCIRLTSATLQQARAAAVEQLCRLLCSTASLLFFKISATVTILEIAAGRNRTELSMLLFPVCITGLLIMTVPRPSAESCTSPCSCKNLCKSATTSRL